MRGVLNESRLTIRAEIAQSVQRLARAWRSGDRILVGARFFRTCPDRPWCPPSLLYNGYQLFPGGKAVGAWR